MDLFYKQKSAFYRAILLFAVLFSGVGAMKAQCPPGAYCFTNAQTTGREGPTQAAIDAEYGSGNSLHNEVTSINGIQQWVVPASGDYEITAAGAGFDQASNQRGAMIQGEFNLTGGDTLHIVVGQNGSTPANGSGGSFVVESPYTNLSDVLIAAGGAGGYNTGNYSDMQGQTSTDGADGDSGFNTDGGSNGQGGQGNTNAGGGGGFIGNGDPSNGIGGFSFINGAEGGNPGSEGEGGFGGGGSTDNTSGFGGGGGYSGGGRVWNGDGAGGGGSFNSGTNQNNIAGENAGNGYVVISPLSSGVDDDAGVTSIDEPSSFCPGNEDVEVTIFNYGENQITSVDIDWEVNGVAQPTFSWTGTLDTIGGTGSPSAQVNLGSFTFTDSAYNVVVWTSQPNGVTDNNNQNDTVSTQIQSNLQAPANLSINNITSNTAEITWDAASASNNWIYSVVPAGQSPGTGSFTDTISTDSVTVTGLSLFTTYDVYVAEMCPGGSIVSSWTDPEFFITCSSLSGTYTIGSSSSADFPDFTTANIALDSCGISGSVLFEIEPGVYNEQIVIGQVPGISSSDTVVFRGQDPATTEISFEQNISSEAYTVRFEDASYITFDSITIRAEDAGSEGWAVHVFDDANNLNFNNVNFITEITSSTSNLGMVVSGSETGYTTDVSGTVSDIKIHDSYFEGGRAGARMNGSTSQDITGVEVVNCEFNEVDRNGLYYSRVSDFTIHNNLINISPNGSTFGAGVWLTNCGNFDITANEVHEAGRYGFYNTNSGGTSANRSLYANNVVTPVRNTGNFTGGIRILNGSSEYIDVIHNSFHFDADGRVFNISNNSPSNIRIWNNNFVNSSTGSGEAMYVSDESSVEAIDYNNYYTAGSDFVYYGSARADLAALQAVNTPSNNDANSVSADPLYTAFDNLLPLSDQIDNEGLGLTQVPIDILGNPRDPNNTSIGAYEFVAPDGDLALIEVQLAPSECLGSNDSIYFTVENTIGSTVDFSVDNLNFHWNVTGPINSNGTITVNSGNLAQGDSLEVGGDGVDMSVPGNYVVSLAYIDTNAVNESTANDTLLNAADEDIAPLLAVSPKIDTVYIPGDSVELSAQSPFFPGGDFFFTEICHWRTASTGAPSTWPAWLPSVDYVEVTGVPNSDLEGITLEQWTETALDDSYTFPSGTVLGPNGTAIIRIGSGSAGSDPANFYYDGVGGSASFFSGAESGKVLKDANGNVIDAVGYPGSSTYSFPAASGVTTADWSGNVPAASGTAGIRLEGAYTKDATNWIVSSAASPQDPNTVNSGVTVPVPGNLTGFSWNYQSAVIDTNVETTVSDFPVNGMYEYIAEYNTPNCGTVMDTSFIYVDYVRPQVDSKSDVSCLSDSTGEITVSATGGATPYTYSWSDDPSRTTSSATGISAGNYIVTIADDSGYHDTLHIEIEALNQVAAPDLGSDTSYCEGEQAGIVFTADTATSYLWSDSSTNQTLTADTAGTYWVEIANDSGCTAADTVMVTENPIPQPDLGADQGYCFGDTTFNAFLAAGVSGQTFLWNDGSDDTFLEVDTAGTYWVEVTDANGCVGSDTMEVVENQLPVVDLGSDIEYCDNEAFTANLDAGALADVIFNWNTGDTGQTLMIDSADTYWVEATDTLTMCSYTDTVEVFELVAPSVTVENDTVCDGEEATLDAGTDFDSYNWSTGETSQSIDVTAGGDYFVTVTNDKGCEDSTSAMVELLPAPAVDLGQDTALNEDEVAVLDAPGGMVMYNWSTGDTTESLEVQYEDTPDTFWVEVMNNDGCFGSDTIFIDQNVSAGAENLFNGDIKVYPNPVRNDANLEINLTKNGTLEIDVFSMSGQILKTKRVGGNAGDNFVPVEMNNLSKGMYMIRVRLDGERLGVFNIAKM